jgi:eukaryotic-like serine/threonine-protein kinase
VTWAGPGKTVVVTADLPEPGPRVVAGRYVLGRVLGTGSSAVVRRARDLRSGAVVALKLFHRGANSVDLRQQRQEMEALAHLDHPGLVGLRDGGNEEGRPFVVTDLVNGPSLDVALRSGPLDPAAVRRLGVDLAAALDHVHRAGYIHRDVKPANVLLDDGGRARLTDFGISRAVDATSVTTAGCIVGTAAYLAPEQVRGEFVGPATDVFALGLVLLEAVTGRREYPGKAMESALARLHRQPTVPEGLPLGLSPVLAAMTHPDPAVRPTAAQVAETLTAPPVPAPAPAAPAVGGPTGRHRRAVLPLAAAAALLVTAGGAIAVLLGGGGASGAAVDPPAAATMESVHPGPAEVVISHDGP